MQTKTTKTTKPAPLSRTAARVAQWKFVREAGVLKGETVLVVMTKTFSGTEQVAAYLDVPQHLADNARIASAFAFRLAAQLEEQAIATGRRYAVCVREGKAWIEDTRHDGAQLEQHLADMGQAVRALGVK